MPITHWTELASCLKRTANPGPTFAANFRRLPPGGRLQRSRRSGTNPPMGIAHRDLTRTTVFERLLVTSRHVGAALVAAHGRPQGAPLRAAPVSPVRCRTPRIQRPLLRRDLER